MLPFRRCTAGAALGSFFGLAACSAAPVSAPPPPPRAEIQCPPALTADAGAPAGAERAPLDGDIQLPPVEQRLRMFDALVAEMVRLDGDGLVFRARRREGWTETAARLRGEVQKAETLTDLGRVFKRLDATYPNLHTRVYLRSELDSVKVDGRLVFPIVVRPERLEKGGSSTYRVARVDAAAGPGAPVIGDRVTAINGRPASAWADENETFCEFPLREQCDADLFERPDILEDLFWHDGGKSLWLDAIRKDGSFAARSARCTRLFDRRRSTPHEDRSRMLACRSPVSSRARSLHARR